MPFARAGIVADHQGAAPEIGVRNTAGPSLRRRNTCNLAALTDMLSASGRLGARILGVEPAIGSADHH